MRYIAIAVVAIVMAASVANVVQAQGPPQLREFQVRGLPALIVEIALLAARVTSAEGRLDAAELRIEALEQQPGGGTARVYNAVAVADSADPQLLTYVLPGQAAVGSVAIYANGLRDHTAIVLDPSTILLAPVFAGELTDVTVDYDPAP